MHKVVLPWQQLCLYVPLMSASTALNLIHTAVGCPGCTTWCCEGSCYACACAKKCPYSMCHIWLRLSLLYNVVLRRHVPCLCVCQSGLTERAAHGCKPPWIAPCGKCHACIWAKSIVRARVKYLCLLAALDAKVTVKPVCALKVPPAHVLHTVEHVGRLGCT